MVQVIRTEGTVLVVSSTSEAQRVVNGMTLEPTATLVAPQGAIVVLEDGTQLVVPQGAPIGVEVLLAESRGEAPVDPTVEALREAIARGEDPTAIQEAPAAGENGGAPGSSRSGFLDASGVGREGRVERTSYEYEGGFTDPEFNDEDEDGLGLDLDPTLPTEVVLSLSVDAPALTSDTTPTIVGTTDAEDGSTVTLVITDSDGNEQTVTATVENGTYSVDAETPLSEGEYSVEASVTDPAGNTATSNDVGEIDASAPALTVDAPALTSDTTPTIVGTTDADDGSTVTLVITDSDGNEQTVTATVENGTYSVDAETPLSEGEYSVEASVSDTAGNTATSNDVGEIDASAPALTVDAPALTSDTTPTIVGTTDAEDGSTVTLVITDSDGNEQTVTATVENGTYSVDAETPLSEGEYSVEASVTDPAGNTATSNDVGALIGGDSGEVAEDGVTEASGALVDVESTDVVAGTQSDDYGTFSVNEAGEWSYTLDNDAAETQALAAGETVTETYTVELSDGSTTTVDILITGVDDGAVISDDSGEVTEDGTLVTSGTLTATDVDGTAPTFVAATDDSSVYGSFTVGSDGEWSYTLDNDAAETQALAAGETVTETYTVELSDGSTTTVDILITGVDDAAPIITLADKEVTEATGETVTDTFQVDADAGIASVTINGTDITTASVDNPIVIPGATDDEGTLTITGYDSGTVSYTYVEDGTAADHSAGDDSVFDNYAVVVTDLAGQSTSDSLDVKILDTAPTAKPDERDIDEDATDELTGNVIDGANDNEDVLGADAPFMVCKLDDTGIADGGSATVTGDYGTLTLNSDGSYTYVLDTTKTQSLAEGEPAEDVFTYVLEDSDGDYSSTTLTINITGSADAVPVITLVDKEVTEATGATVTDTFQVEADAGIASVTINGTDITTASVDNPIVIPGATDDEGTLTITGYDSGTVSYTYVEDGTAADHSAGDDSVFDNYAVVVTD
ncbi:retention module-containing protein, partial [Cobetia marina]|uniref:retention module-containing protein n=1 Tax=Cobetia marina TaxID=28258 RepID=UPI0015842E6A